MANQTRLRAGDKIQITKKVALDKGNKFILDVGEVLTVESVLPTGAARVSKQYSTGELKKAMVSKAYYKRMT